MIKVIRSKQIEYPSVNLNFKVDMPRNCPHCGVVLEPTALSSHFVEMADLDDPHYKIYVHWLCPSCAKAFCSEYEYIGPRYSTERDEATLIQTDPKFCSSPTFDAEIEKVSKDFVKIYTQSHKAEQLGFDKICGMGYRKALEFLVKDFAINFHPEEVEKIKKQPLAQCIENFIDSPKIKTLSKASAWIGNDETHYCRQHEDYNIEHLKAFINAIVSYINSELELKKAEQLVRKSD